VYIALDIVLAWKAKYVKISIVTLSFNQRAFLQEALDSVLKQNYEDIEYIVVDPGSTDGSRELLQNYSGRIAHLVLEPDNGPADGLNHGFAHATGEICGFLNADDLLFDGALRRVVDFFQTHPDCDVVMGNGDVVNTQGKPLRHVRAREFTVARYLYGGTYWLQQSTFFRRESFLRVGGFNVENRTCWDGELFVSMAQQGAVVGRIDADLGKFRLHDASITSTGRLQERYRADRKRIFRKIRGREWRATDRLINWIYRGESALIRLGSQFDRTRTTRRAGA
jgi:glycosyltransferase involved in cell wall biosynthesis